eukprot:scaffold74860_cov22-Tisochrysis_lutea.AAC.2
MMNTSLSVDPHWWYSLCPWRALSDAFPVLHHYGPVHHMLWILSNVHYEDRTKTWVEPPVKIKPWVLCDVH